MELRKEDLVRHHSSSPLESEVVLITGVNVFAHLHPQLNDPIPIDDDDTFPQLLSKSITDFSVKLGNCTQKLSDVFLRTIFISS